MKGTRKVLLICCFVVIDLLLVVGILLICKTTLNKALEKEVNSLVSFDIINDRYDTTIKMHGNYGKVEEAIKSYLNDYTLSVQNVLNYIDYQKLEDFISDSYYLNDISVFNNDLVYLSNLKSDFNNNIDSMLNEDSKTIYNYVYNYIDNVYFVKLYNHLIDEKVMIIIDSNRNYLSFKKSEINAYIDYIYNYVSFLVQNSNNYVVVDKSLKFNSGELEKEYLRLINKIKESKF